VALAICAALAQNLIASEKHKAGFEQNPAITIQSAIGGSTGDRKIASIGGVQSNQSQQLKDVPYTDNANSKAQMLDLYLPANVDRTVPVVVFIHGGGWYEGDKSECPALPMVHKGYAVASINYRLTGQARFPAQIFDCKAAIRWLRAHANQYHLDPNKIAVWGESAGGQLAALLGTSGGVRELEGNLGSNDQDSRVQAVVDWFGPANFLAAGNKDALSAEAVQALIGLLGALPDKAPTLAKAASPITYVNKNAPQFLIMHGDKDQQVPLAQSQELDAALKKAGVASQLIIVNGAGHDEFQSKENEVVYDFFQRHLN
jgi:acetyl esterase/lipase